MIVHNRRGKALLLINNTIFYSAISYIEIYIYIYIYIFLLITTEKFFFLIKKRMIKEHGILYNSLTFTLYLDFGAEIFILKRSDDRCSKW